MTDTNLKYIYGPVYSWRIGMSLGIDPISTPEKVCTFDCSYCQLGRTKNTQTSRVEFITTESLVDEVNQVDGSNIDYYTFAGRGEPTLASNLGDMIKSLKNAGREKIAVITNSSLIDRGDVQSDLLLSDFVIAKLDACSQETMDTVDYPNKQLNFHAIVNGLKEFKSLYSGKFALQIMFVPENAQYAADIARIAKEIAPDEVQVNTPLRPSEVKPLGETELEDICLKFDGLPVVSVYKAKKEEYEPFDAENTQKRHGIYEK